MKISFIYRNSWKISIVIIYFLIFIMKQLGINIGYNQYLIDYISSSSGYNSKTRDIVLFANLAFLSTITVITFTILKRIKSLLLSLFLLLLIHFFLFSFLIDVIEKTRNYEYNSDSGAIWIVVYPITVCVLLLIAALLDYIKNKK